MSEQQKERKTYYLTKETVEKMEEISKVTGVNLSWLVEKALQNLIEEYEKNEWYLQQREEWLRKKGGANPT